MQDILQDLYYGRICPDTKQFVRGSQYENWLNILTECDENLKERLSDELKELLETWQHAHGELNRISSCEDFVEGFRIGAQMMLVVTSEKSGDFSEV